jgi:hypothetical protein
MIVWIREPAADLEFPYLTEIVNKTRREIYLIPSISVSQLSDPCKLRAFNISGSKPLLVGVSTLEIGDDIK